MNKFIVLKAANFSDLFNIINYFKNNESGKKQLSETGEKDSISKTN